MSSESGSSAEFWLELKAGIARFFSRDPGRFEISAPYVNAAVSGTEFIVWANQYSNGVSVVEGQVMAGNQTATSSVGEGETLFTASRLAPLQHIAEVPADKVDWSLFYPTVVTLDHLAAFDSGPALQALLSTAAEFAEHGDITNALNALADFSTRASHHESGKVSEAALIGLARVVLYLEVGQIEQALEAAGSADLPLDNSSNIELSAIRLSLFSVIASARHERQAALDLADQALQFNSLSPIPHLAKSLALQESSRLEEAVTSARDAVSVSASDAASWTRLGETLLYTAQYSKAQEALDVALTLSPGSPRALSLSGFMNLFDHDSQGAETLFRLALDKRSDLPEPRIGLGLVHLRRGEFALARLQFDLAVSLDPNRSLLRSLLGEAFFATGLHQKAMAQWRLARMLDPLDPTPAFYSGVLHLLDNRSVEALQDMQTARALNSNRSVVRSEPLLASDSASQSAAIAQTYRQLGMLEQVRVEGHRALRQDITSAQGHRLLADIYRNESGLEAASVSELLQAQLWQPLTAYPVPPQLSETDLNIVAGLGPERPGLNEYHPLFLKDGPSASIGAFVGADDTFGNDVVLNYLKGPVSLTLGQYYYATDGFRANADQQQEIYNILAQWQPAVGSNLQFEYRRFEWARGNLGLAPNIQNLDAFEADTVTNTYRLGGRMQIHPGQHLLMSLISQNLDDEQADTPAPFVSIDSRLSDSPYSLELQHVGQFEELSLVSGLGTLKGDRTVDIVLQQTLPPPVPPFINQLRTKSTIQQDNAYSYLTANPLSVTSIQLGLAFNQLSPDNGKKVRQWSPKFGLVYSPQETLDLRVAAFRTFRREPVAEQTLEPTSLAGFNQLYDDLDAVDAKNYGLGIDFRPASDLFLGAQGMLREIDFRFTGVSNEDDQPSYSQVEEIREKTAEAYVNHVVNTWLTLNARVVFDVVDNEYLQGVIDETDFRKTLRVPLSAYVFLQRWRVELQAQYLRQHSRTSILDFDTLETSAQRQHQTAWIGHAGLQYRLPGHKGLVELGIDNLGDVRKTVVRSDGEFLQFYPGRFWYGRAQFSF